MSRVFKSIVIMSFFGASVSITLESSGMFGNSVVASVVASVSITVGLLQCDLPLG